MKILNSELTGVFSPNIKLKKKKMTEKKNRINLKTHSNSLPNPDSISNVIE